jgi:hypothetical protein
MTRKGIERSIDRLHNKNIEGARKGFNSSNIERRIRNNLPITIYEKGHGQVSIEGLLEKRVENI